MASKHTSTVLKALGVFGGVQGINILAGIVRTKCAALWIGPEGVGIIALFVQTIMTLSYISQLSLRQSAVRDLSPFAADSESPMARTMAYTARTLSLWLGIGGMILTIALAPDLSRWTFGSEKYAWSFRILSLTLLASSLNGADNAILQSFGLLKKLAKANVFGSVAGTAILAGCLFFWRMDGITGALLGLPLCLWFFSFIASKGIPSSPDPRPSIRLTLQQGKGMLTLGIYLTITDFITQFSSYIFSIYLNREASTADVGIYQSGFTMVNQYVGVIFTAITMEFYPRLSARIDHKSLSAALVSHEMAVALWVLMPVAVLFVCFDELMVRILYSKEFLAMLPFISLAIAGVVFRAVSWCMAYVILAKGDGKIYMLTEAVSAAVMLALYTTAWPALGFTGLGLAYIVWYGVYAGVVYLVFRYRYRMRLGKGMGLLILISVLVCGGASALRFAIGPVWTGILILPWLIPLCINKLGLAAKIASNVTKRSQD